MELPSAFAEYTRRLLGTDEYGRFAAALEREPAVSVRVNSRKAVTSAPASSSLSRLDKTVPWSSTGYYLERRPSFTLDPLFHAGCYYVQEASSMFMEQALRQYVADRPVVMLDLCAAPGGKSTHACDLLPAGSLLVANEVIRSRVPVLAENLTKWGRPDTVVTCNDPADFMPLGELFDVVLADVPCSGEGMFRKDPAAMSQWSMENVENCRQRQRRIITDIWPCLKQGGILIYSTCTFNTRENEENLLWMQQTLDAEVLPLQLSADWPVTGNLLTGCDFPVYRFLPHKTEGEGFFMAVLRKTSVSNPQVPIRKRAKNTPHGNSFSLKGWLQEADNYEFTTEGGRVTAFPKSRIDELTTLRSTLRIVQAGVAVAEQKGRDWVPTHALAMSCALRPQAFTRTEVTLEQALAYLRREAIRLSPTLPLGLLLLTYAGHPIGFVKNIGNRANNLYPQEWRIRMLTAS